MYFGLQAGMVNAMPMQSALVGFALLQCFKSQFSTALAPHEIALIEVIAGALGLAPFTSGLTSFIPALQYLVNPGHDTAAAVEFTPTQLFIWSLSICGLGIIIGAPFGRLFILQERLRFPSATATGTLIGVLFDRKDIIARASPSPRDPLDQPPEDSPDPPTTSCEGHDRESSSVIRYNHEQPTSNQDEHESNIRILLLSLAGSAMFGIVSYLVLVLHRVPIFGSDIATEWLWAFNLSPAYLGYGIIIGPAISNYTLLGAVVGWGILSPIAKHNGWAPGPIDEFDNGARGWILCVGMGLILGDTTVALVWITIKLTGNILKTSLSSRNQRTTAQLQEQVSLLTDSSVRYGDGRKEESSLPEQHWSSHSLVTPSLAIRLGSIMFLLYLVSLLLGFRNVVSSYATPIAALVMPLAALISMRSLGETDNGAGLAIGRLAQFINALIVPPSSTSFTSTNLLLSGAIESGASQASQHMGGLRTAHMTNAAPRAVLHAQMIGSYVCAFIAVSLYKTYTSIKKIPSQEFGIPDAHLYIVTSRMIQQQGLPPKAMVFESVAFIIDAICGGLRIAGNNRWWRHLVPPGVAMGV
ncbi:hypothetical protein IL306_009224, partial [Fusarium sp. DS 682]